MLPFEVLESFIHLWYPALCVCCDTSLNAGESFICLDCAIHLPKTGFHTYKDNPAEKIFWGRMPLEHAAAYVHFEKAAGVQHLMHAIKYRGKKEIAKMMGLWYGADLSKEPGFNSIDFIVPVPLHPSKLKSRGYNQSEWFAMGLAESMDRPMLTDNLVRIKKSETQTRKTRYKRWENVSEIFGIMHPETFKNKHILLVDDVVTTGATLEACAQTILALNCGSKISIATLAFAN